MPSIDYHVKRSISDPDTARRISTLLDMPPDIDFEPMEFNPAIHTVYRKRTHNPKAAFLIGYMIGQEVHAPRKAIISAMQHILDDMQMSLFKTVLRGGEEGEQDKEEEVWR